MHVRQEVAGDRPAVLDVERAAFGRENVAALVEALSEAVRHREGISLVAEEDGEVLGHVMLTWSVLDAPRRLVQVRVLSPLAVRPDRHGEGIGGELVRAGLDEVRADGIPLVFLEGSPGYYGRLGFEPAGELGFHKPSLRIPDAAFQVARLPGYEEWMTGTLVYSEAFWRCDAVGLRESG